jgi:hypothetical protein
VTWVGTPVAPVTAAAVTVGEETVGEETVGEETVGEETVGEETVGEETAVETKRSLGYEAGTAVAIADDETLFALIKDIAFGAHLDQWKIGSPLLRAILSIAEVEHWTTQRTALALAYTFILKDEENMNRILDMVNKSARPIQMSLHCKTCTCTDKSVNYEDL